MVTCCHGYHYVLPPVAPQVVSPSVKPDRWTLDWRYFFLWTAAGSVVQPTLLHTSKSLVEVNMRDLVLSKIGCVSVSSKGVMLKRKVRGGRWRDGGIYIHQWLYVC